MTVVLPASLVQPKDCEGDVGSVLLADVCEIIMGQAPAGDTYNTLGNGVPLIAGAGDFTGGVLNPKKFTDKPTKLSVPGDIVLSIRASIGDKVWADQVYCLGRGVAALRARPCVDPNYLWHWVSASSRALMGKARGATFLQVNRSDIAGLPIVVPPLDEQRRIAAILDKVDELRAKRRQALAQLDGLAESIFESMFGDLRNWNAVSLHELCHGDLRNGVSPSTRGTVTQQVLTLSAVTGTAFEGGAVKSGLFDRPTPVEQRVSSASLLICRGNGNINLVGRGHFPPVDSESVVFPDTIIAAKPSLARVTRGYLGHLWNTPFIRRQISSRARTTNGTYKVNQAALGQVQIPEPPMPLQQDFSEKLASIDRLRKNYCAQAAQVDALFASLQHRAFHGQL